MKSPLCFIVLFATFAMLLPASASAHSFRCKNDLMSLPDAKPRCFTGAGKR